jgi:hypothetical protein
MVVADPQALAAQGKVIAAQKELQAIKMSQEVRQEKAKTAVNFLLLPLQTKDGVVRQEPEYHDPEVRPKVVAARCAAYGFLARYFSTTTDFEAGIPVYEEPDEPSLVATA